MLSVWLDGASNNPLETTILKHFHMLLGFCEYPSGNDFKASALHCSHDRPTWQTEKWDLSKHLDSNQRTPL